MASAQSTCTTVTITRPISGRMRGRWEWLRRPAGWSAARAEARRRKLLAIDVARRLDFQNVLERLADLFLQRGAPALLGSVNGGLPRG